jgi:GNAT superfamily N-acetyltransferase
MEKDRAYGVLTAFRPVRYIDILDAIGADDLLTEYAAECSIPEIGETCPQREIYDRMESSGLMHSFGVFDCDRLVGFATLLVFVLPHYGKKIANVESLFLAKPYRHGGTGRWLLGAIESIAAQMGCTAVLYNARRESRFERFLNAMPELYLRTNSVFLRAL